MTCTLFDMHGFDIARVKALACVFASGNCCFSCRPMPRKLLALSCPHAAFV
jgi:hypothetical protein